VDLAATLRVHEGPMEAGLQPPTEESAKVGPRLTTGGPVKAGLRPPTEGPAKVGPRLARDHLMGWTEKVEPEPMVERPAKAEARPMVEGPAKAEGRAKLEEPKAARREGRLPQGIRIRDLGLGGAGIEIPEAPERDRAPAAPAPIDREAPVTIEVLAPTLWDPLILSGRIVWIRRGGPGRGTRAGVRFEHRESAALYALFRILGVYVHDA
jgi:hypothetical protein